VEVLEAAAALVAVDDVEGGQRGGAVGDAERVV